jgi:uridine phosphorylase
MLSSLPSNPLAHLTHHQQLIAASLLSAALVLATLRLWPAGPPAAALTFTTTNTEFVRGGSISPGGSEGAATPSGAASPRPATLASAPSQSSLPQEQQQQEQQQQQQQQQPPQPPHLSSVNAVPMENGCTMHLGVREGDVAARVLSVGDVGRAERLSAALLEGRRTVTSSRGFVTHTGTFAGVPLTICATLMGFSNMDFVVRELHAVVAGPMAVLRLGTCGGLQEHVPVGTVVLVKAALCVRRNPDAAAAPAPYTQATALPLLHGSAAENAGPSLLATPAFPYDISGRVAPHGGLSALYGERLRRSLQVVEGLGASADSFYSSQGRASGAWGDRNTAVLPTLEKAGVCALEMETCALWPLEKGAAAGLPGPILRLSARAHAQALH